MASEHTARTERTDSLQARLERIRATVRGICCEMDGVTDNQSMHRNHTPCTTWQEPTDEEDADVCTTCRWPEDSHRIREWLARLIAVIEEKCDG